MATTTAQQNTCQDEIDKTKRNRNEKKEKTTKKHCEQKRNIHKENNKAEERKDTRSR